MASHDSLFWVHMMPTDYRMNKDSAIFKMWPSRLPRTRPRGDRPCYVRVLLAETQRGRYSLAGSQAAKQKLVSQTAAQLSHAILVLCVSFHFNHYM